MLTCFLVGFAISQAPFTVLLGTTRPKYIFFVANLVWSFLTLISFRLSSVYQFYIVNFFEGIFTSGAFVGAHFMLGSWYKKNELGKRAAIFVSVGDVGSMAGGWIQAGLFAKLDGHGLPAWRLIFIVVFAMTIPFVFIGLFAIPDLPRHKNAWFLTEDEKSLAIHRLDRSEPKDSLSLKVLFRVVKSWQFWLMPFIFFLYGVSVQMLGNNVMPLWMQSRGYSVIQMNNYPTVIFAFAIVGTLGYSYLSDKLGSRWQASVAIGLTFTVCCPILLSTSVPDGAKFFAFYFLGTCLAPQALWFTWCADVTGHDLYLRSITTGWMNTIDEAFIAWWPIVFYPVTDAPDFRTGYITSLILGTLIVPTVGLIVYLDRRDKRKGKGRSLITIEEEEAGESSEPILVPKHTNYSTIETVVQ